MKYKLIVVAGEEHVTREYEHVVNSLEEAEKECEVLREKWYNDGYPDTYVECLPFNENFNYPRKDFRVWQKDCYGDTYFKWMKVGDICRCIGMYI